MRFRSPTKGEMSIKEVVTDILAYVSEDVNQVYKLLVGTDSHPKDDGSNFASAIIIHRVGKGARYYYTRSRRENIKNMRQRIFYEASLSLELADKLGTLLREMGREDMKVEIHLDIGTHGDTRDMIREVIGMVIGSGFDARIKPDAPAASKVADKYTRA